MSWIRKGRKWKRRRRKEEKKVIDTKFVFVVARRDSRFHFERIIRVASSRGFFSLSALADSTRRSSYLVFLFFAAEGRRGAVWRLGSGAYLPKYSREDGKVGGWRKNPYGFSKRFRRNTKSFAEQASNRRFMQIRRGCMAQMLKNGRLKICESVPAAIGKVLGAMRVISLSDVAGFLLLSFSYGESSKAALLPTRSLMPPYLARWVARCPRLPPRKRVYEPSFREKLRDPSTRSA